MCFRTLQLVAAHHDTAFSKAVDEDAIGSAHFARADLPSAMGGLAYWTEPRRSMPSSEPGAWSAVEAGDRLEDAGGFWGVFDFYGAVDGYLYAVAGYLLHVG